MSQAVLSKKVQCKRCRSWLSAFEFPPAPGNCGRCSHCKACLAEYEKARELRANIDGVLF